MSDHLSAPAVIEQRFGWTPDQCAEVREGFLGFTKKIKINSKEKGPIILGDHLYRAQYRFFDGVFDGLQKDIHDFKHLKSRQLGISTGSRAFTTFWAGIHDGLKGYMVFDTSNHMEEARLELIDMIKGLPDSYNFPRIARENRSLIKLENDSIINFATAGVRDGKTSGTLGRSSGINFCHASEMCSWGVNEGLEAFMNALAQDFENRLYIWESTARGFNLWHEIWTDAKNDPAHQSCIFSGWWSKDNQIVPRNHPDYERYGIDDPTEKELLKIKQVKDLYGWEITREQLAWVRRKMDPAAKQEGDAKPEYEGDNLRLQEQPWVEDDAWQITGSTFFEPERLTTIEKTTVSRKFKTYSYGAGIEFTDCRIYPAHNARSVELKVWEEPEESGAVYIISADPAFGANERNDRSAIQIVHCFADGLDQVAEYAWPMVNSRQFAWVIASLLGWYGGPKNGNDIYLILELNGPGEAVWNELQSLKAQLAYGYQPKEVGDRGLRDIYQNVRNYIYNRSDSMSPGKNFHWRTTGRLKVSIMERLRDFVANGMLVLRSHDTIQEMKSVAREGDVIAAQGKKKDDRVLALAFAVRCWEERVRRGMMANKRTRQAEAAMRRMNVKDQISMFNGNQLETFFAIKRNARVREQIVMRKASWRGRR